MRLVSAGLSLVHDGRFSCADICERRRIRVRHAGLDNSTLDQLAREACDFGVVLLPLWDVLRPLELRLFLFRKVSILTVHCRDNLL